MDQQRDGAERHDRSRPLDRLRLGQGRPKIIVSLTGSDAGGMRKQASELAEHDGAFDIVELRFDHLDGGPNPEVAVAIAWDISSILPAKPLLATFRSKREGGERDIAPEVYAALYRALIGSAPLALIDLELRLSEAKAVFPLREFASQAGIGVIISFHDFNGTPETGRMIDILERQAQAGADICKIAVRPGDAMDVLRLLEATVCMRERHPERPLITMSMGGLGVISRLSGEAFGSVATFGSLGSGSAPGQLPVADMRRALETIAKAMENH